MKLNHEEVKRRKRERFRAWYKRKIEAGEDPIGHRARRRKSFLVGLTGGCQICGYNKCEDAIAFHHLKDKVMQLDVKAFQRKTNVLLIEALKCVIVCNNCHGEIHADLVSPTVVLAEAQEFWAQLCQAQEEFLAL